MRGCRTGHLGSRPKCPARCHGLTFSLPNFLTFSLSHSLTFYSVDLYSSLFGVPLTLPVISLAVAFVVSHERIVEYEALP